MERGIMLIIVEKRKRVLLRVYIKILERKSMIYIFFVVWLRVSGGRKIKEYKKKKKK